MSVFSKSDTSCKICQTREAQPSKNVCSFCERRYDGKGKAYIIACDIYSFYKKGHMVKVWICDHTVNQVHSSRKTLQELVGCSEGEMWSTMEQQGYQLEYKTDKVI